MHKDVLIGETKYIDLLVCSTKGEEFAITSASYELKDWDGKTIESGLASISEHKVSVLLTAPSIAGEYTLTIFYSVPPEVRGIKVIIDVH